MTEQTVPRHRRIHRMALDEFDDAASIKDRMQFISAGRVLMIFPKKGKILQRKLDLVLIQREAARMDIKLALVTTDFAVTDHARELNISTFRTVADARHRKWKQPQNKVFVDRRDRPLYEHHPQDLMRAASRLKAPASKTQRAFGQAMRGGVFGVAILVLLFGFYAVVPGASVTITPARDELNVTVPLVADPQIETVIPETFRIPATVERRVQESDVSVPSTGRRPAENSLAEGIVTLTNDSSIAQFIPAGTVVQTSSVPPVRYETQADAALAASAGATTNVAIRALSDNPDFSANQPPGAIDRIPDFDGIATVANRNATYGEGVREIAVVTESDHERLRDLARTQVLSDARNSLAITLPEGEFLIVPELLTIVDEREITFSAEVGQPAESVTLTINAVVEATIISLVDAELVARGYLGRYVTEGRRLDSDTLIFRSGGVQSILDDGSIAFQMRIEGDTYVAIDEQQVRDRLTGLSVRDAHEVLEAEYLLDATSPPEISTWPGFFNRLPILPIRISVDVVTNE